MSGKIANPKLTLRFAHPTTDLAQLVEFDAAPPTGECANEDARPKPHEVPIREFSPGDVVAGRRATAGAQAYPISDGAKQE